MDLKPPETVQSHYATLVYSSRDLQKSFPELFTQVLDLSNNELEARSGRPHQTVEAFLNRTATTHFIILTDPKQKEVCAITGMIPNDSIYPGVPLIFQAYTTVHPNYREQGLYKALLQEQFREMPRFHRKHFGTEVPVCSLTGSFNAYQVIQRTRVGGRNGFNYNGSPATDINTTPFLSLFVDDKTLIVLHGQQAQLEATDRSMTMYVDNPEKITRIQEQRQPHVESGRYARENVVIESSGTALPNCVPFQYVTSLRTIGTEQPVQLTDMQKAALAEQLGNYEGFVNTGENFALRNGLTTPQDVLNLLQTSSIDIGSVQWYFNQYRFALARPQVA